MPRRKRISKRRRQLTLAHDLMLSLGPPPGESPPEPGSAEWEALHACWEQHRYDEDGPDRYGESSWGYLAFELGDVEAALAANPLEPQLHARTDLSNELPRFPVGGRSVKRKGALAGN
jgi:hypothetical protein